MPHPSQNPRKSEVEDIEHFGSVHERYGTCTYAVHHADGMHRGELRYMVEMSMD